MKADLIVKQKFRCQTCGHEVCASIAAQPVACFASLVDRIDHRGRYQQCETPT